MNVSSKLVILSALLFNFLISKNEIKKPKGVDLSPKEIEYIKNTKEDIVYINKDTKRAVNNLCKKGIIKNPKESLLQFSQACQNNWKIVPSRIAHEAIKDLKTIVEKNENKLSKENYEKVSTNIKRYETSLVNKEAQFFFAPNANETFNNLFVNDSLIVRRQGGADSLFQVNQVDGTIGFRVGNVSGEQTVLSRLPVRINFTETENSSNSLVVIGTIVTDNLVVKENETVRGTLTVNGSLNVAGSAVVLDAQNVGSGTGLIFRDKSGNTLNLRSLVAGNNILFDTSNNDQITISAVGTGLGDVTGPVSATDNAITRFDGTTGKVIQNSVATLDDSGNISTTGQIAAAQFNGPLNGNATSATTAVTATTTTNFTGSLAGDVTGTQSATVVTNVPSSATINGQSAANTVINPGASVDNAITRFDGASGKVVQNSDATLDDSGNITTTGTVDATQVSVSGSAVVTDAQNVGAGTGTIFRDKTGNTLNIKSLVEGTNITFDTSNPDQITISATGGGGSGDVSGPASSTDNAITRFDGTTGKVIQNSVATLDDSGNISTTGQITATQFNGPLNGNATSATTATTAVTATTATNFTGSLSGDVTGTQSATVVANVPSTATINGQSAANTVINPGASVDNAITRFDGVSGKVVQNSDATLDDSGNISTTGQVTATQFNGPLNGNATSATTATTAVTATTTTNFTGSLAGDVTGPQSATAVANVPSTATINGQSAANTVINPGASTDNAITRFDGVSGKVVQNSAVTLDDSGNISTTGQITATQFNGPLNGNATSATTAVAATTATNFTGSLSGDVTGTQNSTVVVEVGNLSAATIVNGVNLANDSTASEVPLEIVRRDNNGNFSAGTIFLSGDLNLTASPSTTSAGRITQSGSPFVHNVNSTTNFFAGFNAGLSGNNGTANTGIGNSALSSLNAGTNNTAIGNFALLNTSSGFSNTAVGASALLANNTGSLNVAVGPQALLNNTTGTGNIAIGNDAIGNNTTGGFNIALGVQSLNNLASGDQNIAIGAQAGTNMTTGSSNILIGNDGTNESDTTRIGSTQTACYIAGINGATSPSGIQVLIAADGKLGTTTSSARYKKNIKTITEDLSNKISKLNPVSFEYKSDEQNIAQYGLIAEEVAEVIPELVIYDKKGQPETVKYHYLPVLLLSEINHLRKELSELKNKVNI